MTKLTADQVFGVLDKYILRDGFPFVFDYEKSHASFIHDALTGKEYLDFFSFFASLPLGYNHPKTKDPAYLEKLMRVSAVKPSNSDVYTVEYAEFLETFHRIAGRPAFPNYFLVSGGSVAVENALKAAFDWKIRKNLARGQGEQGTQVIHFRQAFHGRTGYTLSLTNTSDPHKTMYFPKFDWPRITNPMCVFPMNAANTARVIESEQQALGEIHAAIAKNPADMAALIIEPIQSEGGDHHFRPEFLQELRRICDEHEIIYIFDEVQTGIGLSGKMWCFEHYGVEPDMVVFGKKTQVCGLMSNNRVNEVDSVFKVSSRINSTFGGSLSDMVRCQRYLEIIEEERLIEHVVALGPKMVQSLQQIADETGKISNVRGLGLMIAFDCQSPQYRDRLKQNLFERQLVVLGCGDQSIRLRPSLNLTEENAFRGLEIIRQALKAA